ncbi:ABC transporter ATP-binding protein [Pseudohoeflea coraliihabitans]|uniref:ABC transporter ATP-binding protein n=1 Tax=Pseudohoeflea coraliihabitans TaxID=2860393 RepID=A0ABS6WQ64_9HYPH|nr:ABC transporter ATP-binding protein [Pseudohoeflea sp. DP4N28-3]MBW3098121.1 ABC transporter ATP-binding protein [Pseudohoeflea sp. DP4N28-3]
MTGGRRSAGVTFAARLTFADIHHHYGARHVLKGVSLTAEPGEVLCLLGPSGSGKTTLLRIAAGIERQSSGRLVLNDREISGDEADLPPEQRGIGLMFQDFALFPHLTIVDNVRFGLTQLSRRAGREEAMVALDRVGLAHHGMSYPHLLSGGEQQRVALARALAPRPGVLLMDEPFSGLDSRLKDSVRAQTLAILREARATAIVVTHDAEEAMRMGDRIALLGGGELIQTGTAEDLYHRPANLFAAAFFSELNVFQARVAGAVAVTPLGPVAVPQFGDGTLVDVAIRHSGVHIRNDDQGLPARIVARRFLGVEEHMTLAIAEGDNKVQARVRAGQVAPGQREVSLELSDKDILVFESSAQTS